MIATATAKRKKRTVDIKANYGNKIISMHTQNYNHGYYMTWALVNRRKFYISNKENGIYWEEADELIRKIMEGKAIKSILNTS